MPRLLVHANEATAAQRRVYFHLVDATDGITAETGEAAGQPQVSSDGGAWTNTGIGTLSAIGNGRYYADLTQTLVQTAGTLIETRYKSANTAECPGDSVQVVAFDPNDTVRLGLTALPNAAADAAGGLPISDAGGLDLDSKLANTNEVTAARMGALTDWINGGRLDLILDAIVEDTSTTLDARIPAALVGGRMDSSTGAMAANVLTAAATAADFGTEVGTAVWATTTRELTGAANITSTGGTITVSSGGVQVYDFTSAAKALLQTEAEDALQSHHLVLVKTTIATLASQTSFTLTAGSADDNAYNGCEIVIEDSATAAQKAVAVVSDYTGATKTVTLLNDPAIFTMAAGDVVTIQPSRSVKPTVDNRTLDVSATGEAGLDFNNILSTSLVTLHSLTVTGATTLTGAVAANGGVTFSALTVSGATTLTGNVSLGGTLTVTGATSLAALSMTTLTASGAVALQSTLVVSGATTLTGAVTATNASNDIRGVTANGTAAFTESYRSAGAAGSLPQLMYEIIAHMGESAISGTTKTLKKLDGSTTAKTYTLDSSSAPTSITETS